MTKRKNPNPICPWCGKPTRTMDYPYFDRQGHKIASSWITTCFNVTTCPRPKEPFDGSGETMRAARDSYRQKLAEMQGGQP